MLIKYADDMSLVGCVKDTQTLDNYFTFVNFLTAWTEDSSLELIISKTREMRCGADKAHTIFKPLLLNGDEVEQVGSSKYLGTEINSNFSFEKHSESIFKGLTNA